MGLQELRGVVSKMVDADLGIRTSQSTVRFSRAVARDADVPPASVAKRGKSIRILVCGINYAPDLIGVPKYNTELCESLAACGHAVRLVTAPPYYPNWTIPVGYRSRWYTHETLNGVEITRAPIYVPARPSGAKRLLHHASFSVSSSLAVLSAAIRWQPDIVFAIAPSLLSAPIAALAARTVGATAWLHVQDLEIDSAFELGFLRSARMRRMMRRFESKILCAFDRVSTISPQMLRRLEHKGVAPHRLREVRNWADTARIVPGTRQTMFRTSLGLKPTDIVALYSGAMSNKQGLELIVNAAAAVRTSHPAIHFVLCGNGPHRMELARMANGLNNVHFVNLQPVQRLPELLNTADIHLMPQRAEAADLVLPSKLSGMLASGRPIIAMADPGTGIALETEGAGLVIPPGNAMALAAAVTALAQNEGLRARFGTAARLRAEQKWDRVSIIRLLEREFLALERRVGGFSLEHTASTERALTD
jgi:colanic acid biosynthesis glycosyl transferase WcaI